MNRQHFAEDSITIEEWKLLVDTAYDESWWPKLSDDEAHYQIVERIGQPLRVKLLFDSYFWKWVIAQTQIDIASLAQAAELLPGWSHTVAVALESLHFSGRLVQLDLELPRANSTYFPFERMWLKENIFDIQGSLSECPLILGNHILDDILICQANFTDEQRRMYYSSPALSRHSWLRLARHASLDVWVEASVSCLVRLVSDLKKDQTLILREYPSTTTTRQEDLVRWELERRVQKAVFDGISSMRRVNVTIPDLSKAPAPPGCRFPGSVLVAAKM